MTDDEKARFARNLFLTDLAHEVAERFDAVGAMTLVVLPSKTGTGEPRYDVTACFGVSQDDDNHAASIAAIEFALEQTLESLRRAKNVAAAEVG